MSVTGVTLTGVDEKTDIDQLVTLSEENPYVEWGFLYSPKRQGAPGRYPSVSFLVQALDVLPPFVKIALHVCGNGVDDLLGGESVACSLADQVITRSGRLQLNFNHRKKPIDLHRLAALIAGHDRLPVITQIHGGNSDVRDGLLDIFGFHPKNHEMLFDASGGCGQVAAVLEQPVPGARCGYAGGIGPNNIVARVYAINAIVGELPTWIDMESSLRSASDADWFDLGKCKDILVQYSDT
ncbi:hypothetical protein HMI48_00455 [Acidithiobacillus ferrooxidans]|uniref:hypothetical protein n=1 Tax=Acidithiobacillus ferrooxidans TaxID=920 RepID=UPI001C06F122|nr:hypothetical protein [Acidithiobacillus ferrooxidans]MBU2772437.1 hypothetical protein [Acidithiobacillus ferrooxidans]